MKKILLSSAAFALTIATANAEDHSMHAHHAHMNHATHNHEEEPIAPAGVMGTHTHGKGEFMLSYSYMNMGMHGNRNGSDKVDITDVHNAGYMVAPIEMETEMHMFGAMYGITSNVTMMAMLPYIEKEMTLQRRMMGTDTQFKTKSKGWGDVKVSAIYDPKHEKLDNFLFGLGVSLPTGATDKRHDTPMMANMKLPYAMQIGSGSYELLPSATWQCKCENDMFYGAQVKATIRLNDNDENYTLGDKYMATAWAGKKWTSEFSTTLRAEWDKTNHVEGQDSAINPSMTPTADATMQSRSRVQLGLGASYRPKNLEGHTFLVEAKAPIHEDINGYGLETDKSLMLRWRKSF